LRKKNKRHLSIRAINAARIECAKWAHTARRFGRLVATVQGLNILGLVLNLFGVLLLFRYGMPFRIQTNGAVLLVTDQIDQGEIATEALYTA
jgi:hypothetical protein